MYYNADEGDYSDEEVAKEEEAEALKLQKERLSKMSEKDFMEDDFEQVVDDSFGARADRLSGKGKKMSGADASKVGWLFYIIIALTRFEYGTNQS